MPSSSLSPSATKSPVSISLTLCTVTAIRIYLSFTDAHSYVKQEQLLSTPLTSYTRLREGLFLFDQGIDPYSGGLFYHSPLYLSLLSTLVPNSQVVSSILWSLSDSLGAWALVEIWRSRAQEKSQSREALVAASYLLNPYIFLPSIALSSSSLENTLALLSIMFACKGLASAALLSLALLVNLSIPSVLVVAPTIFLLAHPQGAISQLASPQWTLSRTTLRQSSTLLLEFMLYFGLLVGAASVVCGGFQWIPQTWGANLTLPDLTPNTGLWWYFFTEMFDHFRPFFLMAFSVHLLIYIAPICIKFQYDPLYAIFLLYGILGTFKAYPTLSDPGLFLSMISLFPETYPYLRYPIVTTFLHLHSSLLLPLFNHLWLSQGTGNANFFYASTLVFACANGAALMDCIWAGLRVALTRPTSDGEGEKEDQDEWAIVQE